MNKLKFKNIDSDYDLMVSVDAIAPDGTVYECQLEVAEWGGETHYMTGIYSDTSDFPWSGEAKGVIDALQDFMRFAA